eukprot:GHVS01021754.1.p1 GENE.GHVS01021754.1~~GHVS01021754.1.p1  ORF type:complete len:563 (+),score=129.41 GHVS01021754.1:54-1691(+)
MAAPSRASLFFSRSLFFPRVPCSHIMRTLHSFTASMLSPPSSSSLPSYLFPSSNLPCPLTVPSSQAILSGHPITLPSLLSPTNTAFLSPTKGMTTKPSIASLPSLQPSSSPSPSLPSSSLPSSSLPTSSSLPHLSSRSFPKHYLSSREPCRPLQFDDLFLMEDITKTASLLHSELPKRYAYHVREVDALNVVWPGCVDSITELRWVRDTYLSCIADLLALDPLEDFVQLNCVIRSLRRRHNRVVAMLVTALRKVRLQLTNGHGSCWQQHEVERRLDSFLYQFLLRRVSTELLREQYVAALDSGHPTGIVNSNCNILQVLEKSAHTAHQLCAHYMHESPQVVISTEEEEEVDGSKAAVVVRTVEGSSMMSLCCVPAYLYSASVELLKNALRATVEHYRLSQPADSTLPAVKVIARQTEEHLSIEVNDKGGGIPTSEQPKVWSFAYTTAPFAYDRSCASNGDQPPPLAGCGVGLPLSRLYIRYLGGDIWLRPAHGGSGTSAFIEMRPLTESWTEEITRQKEDQSIAMFVPSAGRGGGGGRVVDGVFV